ncbi:hypothetical protein TARUN_63 [Trichoderma arundinaceum]|uniref:Uncharacterized protein n=1 Tax=Trichoderma arundinaceum TaxID=490622 RepID=A0A395P4L2_TRIAR|nr:hypothetical protein TARUN_63 [Trichoderma arundinaceum]
MKTCSIISITIFIAISTAFPTVNFKATRDTGIDTRTSTDFLGYKRDMTHDNKPGHTLVLGYRRDIDAEEEAHKVHTVEPEDANLPDGTLIPTYGCK